MPSSESPPSRLIDVFSTLCTTRGWTKREPEGLLVPYFATEFNRCVEHQELNRAINTPFSSLADRGWFEITPACRTNDMRKVDSGWHATVFEMLVQAGYYSPTDLARSRRELVSDFKSFLIDQLGLSPAKFRITYFAGGEVVPGLLVDADTAWYEEWLKIDISADNLIPIKGPKNFALFVGKGERCGPKCEIYYEIETHSGTRWTEVGTLIIDNGRFRKSERTWSIEPACSIIAGAAYGLERLLVITSHCDDMSGIPPLKDLVDLIKQSVKQEPIATGNFQGDILVLADQVRACLFLLSEGAEPESTGRGQLLNVMLRRIRRKLALLCINNWQTLLKDMESILCQYYRTRYSSLERSREHLIQLVEGVPWPEGLNPESYWPEPL